jgi:hypothetical protein
VRAHGGHDPFTFARRRGGERRNGGRVQILFIHVLYYRDIITLFIRVSRIRRYHPYKSTYQVALSYS